MNFNKKKFLSIILNVTYLALIEANFKYNITLSEMETCKSYLIPATRGYVYTDFFYVHNLNNQKLGPNELLHLKFYVMTARDAHILLSATDHPGLFERVYEVVIGAGRNKFSTIRTSIGHHRVATDLRANILSMLDPVPIEIVQTKDASLKVLIPGLKDDPLMKFTDPLPLNVNYISFATYENEPARWFYDCRFDGFSDEMEREERPLSASQRLLQDMTKEAVNSTPPMDLNAIDFGFQIRGLHYKSKEAVMTTRLNMILSWQDLRLKWNASNFNDIEAITYTGTYIWFPEVVVINGVWQNKLFFKPPYDLYIQSNGSISMIIVDAEVNTWCLNPIENWPKEKLFCEILLGLTSTHDQPLQLSFDTAQPLWKDPISTLTEWTLTQISVSSIENDITARHTYNGIVQTMAGDTAIAFQLARNSKFFEHIFITPLMTCQMLLTLSFFFKSVFRSLTILVAFVVIMLGTLFISKHCPLGYVPNLMHAYQVVAHVCVSCYVLHICIIWLDKYPPKSKPNNCVMKMLNYSPLRLILCMGLADTYHYMNKETRPWKEASKILNAVIFLIVNIVFVFVDVLWLALS